MSAGTAVAAKEQPKETVISYVPLGETQEIHLTVSRVKQLIAIPTKSGALPTDAQVLKFIMLCKAQGLNPFLNDAFLCGYDSKDGPTFSLITSVQAFLKRAESSPEYEGIEQGVIVQRGDQLTERAGDLVLQGETLIGGWARVHRKDRRIPSYDALNLGVFNTGYSRWKIDPAGMICKCAMASALRTAFPSTLAAIYCQEEMDRQRESWESIPKDERSKTERLAEKLTAPKTQRIEHQEQPQSIEMPKDDRELVSAQQESTEAKPESKVEQTTPDPLAGIHAEVNACETEDAIAAIFERVGNDPAMTADKFDELRTWCEGRSALLQRRKK